MAITKGKRTVYEKSDYDHRPLWSVIRSLIKSNSKQNENPEKKKEQVVESFQRCPHGYHQIGNCPTCKGMRR